jgi:hypothetical protein
MQRIVLFLLLLSIFVTQAQGACTPTYDGSTDTFSACTYAESYSENPCYLQKTSTWTVDSPDSVQTTFSPSADGDRLWSKSSCSSSTWITVDKYPAFNYPLETGEGYIKQFVRRAYVVPATQICSGYPNYLYSASDYFGPLISKKQENLQYRRWRRLLAT